MFGAPQAMDIDGDHEITLEELVRFMALYGQDRTIHRPQPVERYYQSRLVSSQFQLFKPVSPPPVEPIPPSDSDKTAANAETDLTEETMESDETPIDDATYEEITASRQIPAIRKYDAAPETLRGVPAWFIVRDRDGDGQVSLKEFAPSLSAASLALFGRLDKNGDGFITPDEVRPPTANKNADKNKAEPQP
jgi:Ca2+-binding EF-hand superfamily protein